MTATAKVCALIALGTLLVALFAAQPALSEAETSGEAAEDGNAEGSQQQKAKGRKMAAGWVQSYKEPPNQAQMAQQSMDGGALDEEPTCTIKVQKVEKYSGKCVRLRGGAAACQTDTYLDPVNEDCMFLD